MSEFIFDQIFASLFGDDIQQGLIKLNLTQKQFEKLKSGHSMPFWLINILVYRFNINPLYIHGKSDKMFLS